MSVAAWLVHEKRRGGCRHCSRMLASDEMICHWHAGGMLSRTLSRASPLPPDSAAAAAWRSAANSSPTGMMECRAVAASKRQPPLPPRPPLLVSDATCSSEGVST